MASTYSDLKIQLMATGENSGTWGDITNTNLGTAIEEAITGSANVAFSSADVTLTLINDNASQTARNLRLNLTGTSGGNRNLIVPAIEKIYIINNGLANQVTVKNATGTGIVVPAGKTMYVYNNGTNVVDAITHLTSLTLGSALPVASGGTGITSFGTGVATFLGTPSSANLAAAVTDETGTGALVFATSPTLVTPALGTPASGVVTNLTGTASININGTVGASTPSTVASTNLSYTGTLTGGTGVINIGSGQVVKDASGNVGIGTSTPQSLVNLFGSDGNSVLTLSDTTLGVNFGAQLKGYGVGGQGGQAELGVLDAGVYRKGILITEQTNSVQFHTGGAEKVRITSSGNVGIGTSSPIRKLDVLGDTTVAGFYRNVDVGVVGAASMQVELGARSGTTSTAGGSIGAQLNNATTGELQLYSRTGGALTEKVRITSSGNVGIGTSSPISKLHVVTVTEGESAIFTNNNANINANNKFGYIVQEQGIDRIRLRYFRDGSGIAELSNMANGPLVLSTNNGAERARIDASGNLLVGTTSVRSSGKVSIDIVAALNAAVSIRPTTDVAYDAMRFLNTSSSLIGLITCTTTATTYGTSSDYRLKEDAQPVLNPIDRLMQLKPINFAWKVDGSRTDGFLAHEAQAVVPEAVTGQKDAVDKDGKPVHQGIDQSKLVPLLTAALQELSAKVDTLQAELNTLKGN